MAGKRRDREPWVETRGRILVDNNGGRDVGYEMGNSGKSIEKRKRINRDPTNRTWQ